MLPNRSLVRVLQRCKKVNWQSESFQLKFQAPNGGFTGKQTLPVAIASENVRT